MFAQMSLITWRGDSYKEFDAVINLNNCSNRISGFWALQELGFV